MKDQISKLKQDITLIPNTPTWTVDTKILMTLIMHYDVLEELKKSSRIVPRKNVYIFQRSDMFYPLELGSDVEAIENAKCNPGTAKVENAVSRIVIWESPDKIQP